MPLSTFHPAVAAWFASAFPKPTQVQAQAWAAIGKGRDTLIAAPTGSGKTLAAFLSVIDNLVKQSLDGLLPDATQVVYVSPLKALSNDIEKNLRAPLAGIERELEQRLAPAVNLRVAVRTGDTPVKEREAMRRTPPHILITTPESLFLLLTSESGRRILGTTKTLIVDELHALVDDKRGAHLSLSLERLAHLAGRKLTRIGLSATQKPIEEAAKFLGAPEAIIIDTGHKRVMDLSLELPRSPLTAVMANEVWDEIYERLTELIRAHKTTLLFVNTRRLAERAAHALRKRLGDDRVTAHHGSLSRDQRLNAEERLKSGQLSALVATASLELGIDIGHIDLVCQLGSPRSIAGFLQRAGRAGHQVTGTPKAKLFPLTRDDLLECAALFDSIRRGELDRLHIPEKPIDILAQQIAACAACEDWGEEALYNLCRGAYPYRNLTRSEFDAAVTMLADGFSTRRGRRGALLFHDAVNGRITARKGTRLIALTNGGSIPDMFDYDVVLEPENLPVGTVNEDFAIESVPGDIFQLGNGTWRILKVDTSVVRVADAKGAAPTLPFWLGEAPGRTDELSFAVSRLREEIGERLDQGLAATQTWLQDSVGLNPEAAETLTQYLAAAKGALGVLPTQTTLVMERFFDEAGDMHLVIHSPFGTRMNRAWGLSLRKRFCRTFNFELQAAATDDAIVMSLGPTHSFPLPEVFHYLKSHSVRDILIQAVFDAPLFKVRWRWNASRALAVPRRRGDKRVPPGLQRMMSEDLIAHVFPDQLACLENIQGDREIPDHPLVKQTIEDCLSEAMDIGALELLLKSIESGERTLIAKDLTEPSPLAHEILNARPYSFLDDAPLEERRTRAVQMRRWLDPAEAKDLAALDPNAIARVRGEAFPEAETIDELHDALLLAGYLTAEELTRFDTTLMQTLFDQGRAARIDNTVLYTAAERWTQFQAVFPGVSSLPPFQLPEKLSAKIFEEGAGLKELIRGRLDILGPVLPSRLAFELNLPVLKIEGALAGLETEGFAFRGRFTPGEAGEEWCERRLLARIHRHTLEKLREEIEPVSPAVFMRYLFTRHGLQSEAKPKGHEALLRVITLLEGFEAPAAAWETDILPARMEGYDPAWLDYLCLSGRLAWGRFRPPATSSPGGPVAVATSPVALVQRVNFTTFASLNAATAEGLSSDAQRVLGALTTRGALFAEEIAQLSGLLPAQAEAALKELTARGLVTCDGFAGLRKFVTPARKVRAARRRPPLTALQAGRWSLLRPAGTSTSSVPASSAPAPSTSSIPAAAPDASSGTWAETAARILLQRYGIVFRKLADREAYLPPWRQLLAVYRRLEARGELRGGRFVTGVAGEQYALPSAVADLRRLRKQAPSNKLISISAADPLNLYGVLTPEETRVPSLTNHRLLFRDGLWLGVKEGEKVSITPGPGESEAWDLEKALLRRPDGGPAGGGQAPRPYRRGRTA